MTIEQRGSKRGPRVMGSNNSNLPSNPKITIVPAHHVSFALSRSRSWNRHETVIDGRVPKRKNFVNLKLWFDRLKPVVVGKLAPRTEGLFPPTQPLKLPDIGRERTRSQTISSPARSAWILVPLDRDPIHRDRAECLHRSIGRNANTQSSRHRAVLLAGHPVALISRQAGSGRGAESCLERKVSTPPGRIPSA
jgi:hypothetical protein